MNFDPQSAIGNRLHAVLTDWMNRTPEPAAVLNKLKRAFVSLSSLIENEDQFISLLYGQSVLDESPFILSQRVPAVLLRVECGIEASLNKKCWKELVVALEQSKNENFLTRILSWAETHLSQVQEIARGLSMDPAPQRLPKSKLFSQLTAGSVTARQREIDWSGEDMHLSVLEICNNKIILGFSSGQIKIYSSDDLTCNKLLNYFSNEASVTCLQCTCTEIITGYSDGNICVWSVETGILIHRFATLEHVHDRTQFASSMRWKGSKLVIATNLGRVKIWQYVSSSFTLLGGWNVEEDCIDDVDFNESYVVLHLISGSVQVRLFNGSYCRPVSDPDGQILCMSLYYEDRVVTAGASGSVRIWETRTGICLKELQGHEWVLCTADAYDGIIAGVNGEGKVVIWNAALEIGQAKLDSFRHPNLDPYHGAYTVKLGTNVLAAGSRNLESRSLAVVDYLAC